MQDPNLSDQDTLSHVDAFLTELCGQSWRTSLDAGLETANQRAEQENLLVIASEAAVGRVCSVATGSFDG